MLITAKEARLMVQRGSEDVLSFEETQMLSQEIRAKASQGLCEAIIYPPTFDTLGEDSVGKVRSRWSRAARAALIGGGFDVEILQGGSGRSLRVRW